MTNDISLKKVIFECFYSHYKTFYVLVATRVDNVSLPDDLMQGDFIKLAIGSGSSVGMAIDDKGIAANLTFNRYPIDIFVPWESVVNIETDFFSFGQKFNPIEDKDETISQIQESIISAKEEKSGDTGLDDAWITKDTKYSHLKL